MSREEGKGKDTGSRIQDAGSREQETGIPEEVFGIEESDWDGLAEWLEAF